MSSDVVLTAALRNNLLSLQNTQSLIDQTQLRLATGLKVNSALDNPQNFFAAQSLSNRANDLTRLLDGIGQSITAIKQANTAVESLTNLVEQADSIAQQARDALSGGQQEARAVGTVDLSKATELVNDFVGLTENDQLDFTYIRSDGTTATSSVVIGTTAGEASTGEELVALINAITDSTNGNAQVFDAKLNDSGALEVAAVTGESFEIVFTSAAATVAGDRILQNALGFGSYYADQSDGTAPAATNEVGITFARQASLESVALVDTNDTDVAATRSTLLTDLRVASNTSTAVITGDTLDNLQIGVNGGTLQEVIGDLATATVQDLIDGINTDTDINKLIEASFNEDTGQITIRAIDASVKSIQFGALEDAGAATGTATSINLLALGFGTTTVSAADAAAANAAVGSVSLGESAAELADLEDEFNNIRSQIDKLVADSGYRGTNLLNGDDLTTFFNEDRSNSLTTEGAVFTSTGLGIDEANFGTTAAVDAAITNVRNALTQVRTFGGSIANDLAILQTREDFTTNTVNNLKEGKDKLTVADQNEEGANLLALQTRQTLGVTSLSLASQSQQAVLRLF